MVSFFYCDPNFRFVLEDFDHGKVERKQINLNMVVVGGDSTLTLVVNWLCFQQDGD